MEKVWSGAPTGKYPFSPITFFTEDCRGQWKLFKAPLLCLLWDVLDLHALKKILHILQKVPGISWLWGKIKVCKNEGHRLQGRVLDGYLQDELFMGGPVAQALLFKDAA